MFTVVSYKTIIPLNLLVFTLFVIHEATEPDRLKLTFTARQHSIAILKSPYLRNGAR